MLALFAVIFPLTAARAERVDDVTATVRRVSSIAVLAAQEYRTGFSGGKLVSPKEQDEAKLFLSEARRSAALLPPPGGPAAVRAIDSLVALVAAAAPPDTVSARAQALGDQLAAAFSVTLDDIPAEAPSLAHGADLFAHDCATCHGMAGRGDGPSAAGLSPRPADLTSLPTLADRSPLDFYRRISLGVPGTAMPAYEAQLAPADRWALAVYASTLRLPSPAGTAPPSLRTFPATAVMTDRAVVAVLAPAGDLFDPSVAARVAAVRRFGTDQRSGLAAGPVFDKVRAQLAQGIELARQGKAAEAGAVALDAYMTFEAVEGAVSSKDGALGSRLESAFAAFRARAAGGAGPDELARLHSSLLAGLEEAERTVADVPSPLNLFVQSLALLLREGLEAILIVGALIAFLLKTGAKQRTRDVHIGVAAAIAASLLTAVALETIFEVSSARREALEGATMVVATGVLFYVSYWLLSKMEVAKWNRFVKAQVQDAVTGGSALALASVAFLAVYREGFETVLFYKALFLSGGSGNTVFPVVAGMVVGAVGLTIIYIAINRFGVRIPLKPFFAITSAFLYYMAFVFAGKGIAELQGAGVVSLTPFSPEIRFPTLGIYSTWETLSVQAVLVLLLLGAVVWTFLVEPRRLRVTGVMVPEPAAPAAPRAPVTAVRSALDPAVGRSLERMEADLGELRAELERLKDRLVQDGVDRLTKGD
ncbi:MAG TPA: cytochrome c/FTR1 family iron permease [Gemmatimonadales bacterium]|nr:cytochrome c/FTR1 family iron permease [Gemmatimonadales bacterium]